MKLNKLVVSMGLTTAILSGCVDDFKSTFFPTAIDGYIVNGLVTTTCGEDVFTGRTNEVGVAALDITPYTADECTSKVTGDEQTYDADAPTEPWLHTMETLPGEAVINPFTTVAATIAKVPGNEGLDKASLKNKVLETLGFDDNHAAAAVLFADYGATAATDETAAEAALLAQATFDVTTEAKSVLGETNNNPTNLTSLLAASLKSTAANVVAKIATLKAAGSALNGQVIAAAVTFPDLNFSDDGSVVADNLKYLVVGTATQEKSKSDAVSVAEIVKAAQAAAEAAAEAAVAAAPEAEKIARQAVTAKVVVKKVEAQKVVAEKVVAEATEEIKTATGEAKAAAEAKLAAAQAAKAAAEAAKAIAESSAAAAKATLAAEVAVNSATGEAKAAAEAALAAAKAAAEAEVAKVKAEEEKVAAAEAALEAAAETAKAAAEAAKAAAEAAAAEAAAAEAAAKAAAEAAAKAAAEAAAKAAAEAAAKAAEEAAKATGTGTGTGTGTDGVNQG